MNIIPVYYVIAIFLMLAALFSLRYEITFLKSNKVSTFIWTVSILNFITVVALIVVLLIHHLMNQVLAIKIILALLLSLFIISAVQIISRRRLFAAISNQLQKRREEMIHDMMDMIDEKKRDKIREKYDEDKGDPSSNGKGAGK
jgi:ABC-type transport system involved in cytochrome bd biosynthesis fused ATPase/permease subunit